MRIGTSRSDRIGFIVFAALAAVLAVLVVTNLNSGSTESAQEVATFADIAPAAVTSVPETAPIAMPTALPEPEPFVPLSSPEDDADEDPEEDNTVSEEATEASTADGDSSDEGTVEADSTPSETATTETTESADAEPAAPAPAADAPNPQPQAAEEGPVPNPQLPEGDDGTVPNPQLPADAEGAVPNPQLPADAEAAVPNPQPAAPVTAAAPVSIPADAPAGGTFTHTLTATVSRPTLHSSAGGAQFTPTFNGTALPAVNPTVFGNPLVYRVLAGEPGDAWAKVYVPARPNGTTAWVQTSQFNWGSSNQLLQINITTNTVTLFEGGTPLISTSAVTGKSSSRTPVANGWVEEIMAGPSAAFGPRLISLGIYSEDLNSFGGSVPKIALHGTNNPSLMGQYASNGCIRVPNDVISQIAARVKIGSKVIITR